MLFYLPAEDVLLAGEELLLVLLPALHEVAHDAEVLQLVADVDHLLVHAVGHVEGLAAGRLAALVLPAEVHLLVNVLVVLLEEAVSLQAVDVSAHEDVHGLETHHHVVAGTARAVADGAAVGTEPVGLLLSVLVILEAVLAVLASADILVMWVI